MPPTAILVISDGANMSGRTTPDAAARQARSSHIPVYAIVLGTENGVVTVDLTGGYKAQIRVPPSPDTLRRLTRSTGGEFYTARDDERLKDVYRKLGSRLGHRKQSREISRRVRRRLRCAAARGRRAFGAVVPEGSVKRLLLLAFLATGAVGAAAQPAQATNECRGLMVCVRVAGPWVVVPAARGVPRAKVEYQLSCPRGFVVGGLDAELSDRALDITFVGKLGSPVNPGVTTSRAAVFNATYAGAPGRASSFRPHLGCIPSVGRRVGPVPFKGRCRTSFPPPFRRASPRSGA